MKKSIALAVVLGPLALVGSQALAQTKTVTTTHAVTGTTGTTVKTDNTLPGEHTEVHKTLTPTHVVKHVCKTRWHGGRRYRTCGTKVHPRY